MNSKLKAAGMKAPCDEQVWTEPVVFGLVLITRVIRRGLGLRLTGNKWKGISLLEEVLSMFNLDARFIRLEIVRDRADKRRNEAIKALGGVCPGCKIERDPRDLKVVPLTEVSKKWSKQLLFRRVAEASVPGELARLTCKKCHFNELQERKFIKVAGGKVREKGTGEFYWIGGERVEQMRKRTGIDDKGYLVIYPKHEDVGVELLERDLTKGA